MNTAHDPVTVLVAGMPRSGSTWQFNAARLILRDAGTHAWTGWIDDWDDSLSPPIRLIKVHLPEAAAMPAQAVLTTFRPFPDCLRSQIRMGWLVPERDAVRGAIVSQQRLYEIWARRSTLETRFDDIVAHPLAAIRAIDAHLCARLGLSVDPDRAVRVLAGIDALTPPGTGHGAYDKLTLLHPRHIGTTSPAPDIAAWVADLVGQAQPRTGPDDGSASPR